MSLFRVVWTAIESGTVEVEAVSNDAAEELVGDMFYDGKLKTEDAVDVNIVDIEKLK